MARGIAFLRRHCSFSRHGTVHEGCSSHPEYNPALPCLLWQRKRSCYPGVAGSFFSQRADGIESREEPEPVPSASGENCSLPSVSYCWRPFSSSISHILSLLQSVTLLACSLLASPCMSAVVLYYWTYQDAKCKIQSALFFVCFLCIICGKSITHLLQYDRADCVSWAPRLTLLDLTYKLDLWTRAQNGTRL